MIAGSTVLAVENPQIRFRAGRGPAGVRWAGRGASAGGRRRLERASRACRAAAGRRRQLAAGFGFEGEADQGDEAAAGGFEPGAEVGGAEEAGGPLHDALGAFAADDAVGRGGVDRPSVRAWRSTRSK